MSALARYFIHMGKNVAGYDRISTPLTKELIDEGADIHFTEDVDLIPAPYKNPENTVIIFTPAVPITHLELQFFKNHGFKIKKRSDILGLLTRKKKTIAVAGTHGKTTVSSMIAHLLYTSGIGCNAFFGGISKNYQTNVLLSDKSNWIVAEADEFDRSFLRLYPDMAIITSCDPDHLDIYRSEDELRKSFSQFTEQIRDNGILLIKKNTDLKTKVKKNVSVYTYALKTEADFRATNIKLEDGIYRFDIHTPDNLLDNIILTLPGLINVENATAAAALAYLLKIAPDNIKNALGTYTGVRRRVDILINTPEIVYIDDYAHHPRELDAIISSVKKLFPGRKISGIFQPHLFSRTRDFAESFANSLSQLDELILLDIYPAREEPIEGVDSGLIFNRVQLDNKTLCTKEQLLSLIKFRDFQVLLTLGAGDIDQFVEPVKEILMKKQIKDYNE